MSTTVNVDPVAVYRPTLKAHKTRVTKRVASLLAELVEKRLSDIWATPVELATGLWLSVEHGHNTFIVTDEGFEDDGRPIEWGTW